MHVCRPDAGVADTLALALALAERVSELLGVRDLDAAGEREREGLLERDVLVEGEAGADKEALPLRLRVREGLVEREKLVKGDAKADSETLPLTLGVLLALALGLTLGVGAGGRQEMSVTAPSAPATPDAPPPCSSAEERTSCGKVRFTKLEPPPPAAPIWLLPPVAPPPPPK